jgi:type II secretory pathway pseudopilin PulG
MRKENMTTQKHLQKTISGFSLLEMAVVLIIAGILIVPLIKGLDVYFQYKDSQTTKDNIAEVNRAIAGFVQLNGRLPCPARIDATPSDPDFGEEQNCATTLPGEVPGAIAGTDTQIVIGAVPFRDLNIRPSDTIDGWDNRLTFAVTKRLAIATTPPPTNPQPLNVALGTIAYEDSNGISLVTPANTAIYALVSHGEKGDGAHTSEGILKSPCPTVGATVDFENCNNDSLFVSLPKDNERNYADGAQYFDDYAGGYKNLANNTSGPNIPVCTTGQVLTNTNGTLQCVNVLPNCTIGQALVQGPNGLICETIRSNFMPPFIESVIVNGPNCSAGSLEIRHRCPDNYSVYGIPGSSGFSVGTSFGIRNIPILRADESRFTGFDYANNGVGFCFNDSAGLPYPNAWVAGKYVVSCTAAPPPAPPQPNGPVIINNNVTATGGNATATGGGSATATGGNATVNQSITIP